MRRRKEAKEGSGWGGGRARGRLLPLEEGALQQRLQTRVGEGEERLEWLADQLVWWRREGRTVRERGKGGGGGGEEAVRGEAVRERRESTGRSGEAEAERHGSRDGGKDRRLRRAPSRAAKRRWCG